MRCPNCGAQLKNGKCDYCGYDRKEEEQPQNTNRGFNLNINIGNNGININNNGVNSSSSLNNQEFQGNQPQSNYNPNGTTKSRWIALLLVILFGGIGVHHFYVGRIGMGILYFFTGGLFGIGIIIDIIKILTGTFKDSKGEVLQ